MLIQSIMPTLLVVPNHLFYNLVNPFKPLFVIESLQAFFNFHPIIFLNISLDEVRTYNKEMKDDNGCCLLF